MKKNDEIVTMRIDGDDKEILEREAERECRTFAAQCRFVLRQWCQKTHGKNK